MLTPMRRPAESSPSGPPGVDRGIGLDDVTDDAARRALDLPVDAAHDARGERLVEAEGVADREDALADEQVVRRADRDRAHVWRRARQLEHRDVVAGVGADD